MSPAALRLERVEGEYAICRLGPGAEVPQPAAASFHSVTRTPGETSLVCSTRDVPAGAKVESPFAALRIAGTLEFSMTGVLSGLTAPLAAAGVSVFAISTFDTDYLLVPADLLGRAAEALREGGHEVGADIGSR